MAFILRRFLTSIALSIGLDSYTNYALNSYVIKLFIFALLLERISTNVLNNLCLQFSGLILISTVKTQKLNVIVKNHV